MDTLKWAINRRAFMSQMGAGALAAVLHPSVGLASSLKREGSLAGLSTGFSDLDVLLGGLHNSDLVLLAGRPDMGMTALAANIAYNAAYDRQKSKSGEDGAVVGYFSLEMSMNLLTQRILTQQTEIPLYRIRNGEICNDELSKLSMASQALHQIPLYIEDIVVPTVSELRTHARWLKRVHGLDLIVVDNLAVCRT